MKKCRICKAEVENKKTCEECLEKTRAYTKKRKENKYFHYKAMKIKSKATCEFSIDGDYLESIWTGYCPISGEPLIKSISAETARLPNSCELDRIDPNKGYIEGNVVWLSRRYNRKKNDNTIEDLEKILKWLKEQ